jgi:hypothetical protein
VLRVVQARRQAFRVCDSFGNLHSWPLALIWASRVAASANSRAISAAVSGNRLGVNDGRLVRPADDDDGWVLVGFDQLNGQYVYGSDLA